MTEVNGQIDLVRLGYFELLVLFVFHEHSDELIANLRGMFRVIDQTELLSLHLLFESWLFLDFKPFTLDFLGPSDLVQTLTEENHVHQTSLVEAFVHSLG